VSQSLGSVKPKQSSSSNSQFPFLDLQAQFSGIKDEIMAALDRVMDSQHFILGPEVAAFEAEVATCLGTKTAVGCASGSDALLLALMALGVEAGDEVITTPFTFVATAGAIARLGARPVFVDIDPHTYNIDVKQIENAISARTRALMPVHLFGLAADMEPIMRIANERGLTVIEDAAQAIGARYKQHLAGNMGAVGCFSFFPSKNLGGVGDGGLMTSNDPALAGRLKLLRAHGSREKYRYEILGVNSRLDAIQAAILRVKLKYLPQWTELRRQHADQYRRLFSRYGLDTVVQVPLDPVDCYHVYNQFTIRVRERDRLREFLTQKGIPTEVYYPLPLHLQPAFAYLGYKAGDFPHAEAASGDVLSLPIYPELSAEQQERVVTTIAHFCNTEARSTSPRSEGVGI
jgi:dTDP-4-amino-4,6-dideoxygalactose transaminase